MFEVSSGGAEFAASDTVIPMRRLVFTVLYIAGLALCVVSLLPLVPTYTWWVRAADFPRLQFAVMLLVLILATACFIPRFPRSSLALIASMAAMVIYHGVVLAPYAPTDSSQAQAQCAPEERLSVMVANVRLGHTPAGQLLKQVRRWDPDVLLAMEVDRKWMNALSALEPRMPHHISRSTGSYFGIALYSKLPLVSPEIRHLAGQDTPQIVTGLKLRNGETIDFLGLHPRPPLPSQSALGRDAVLMKAAMLLRDNERPGVVAGDLNATPWEAAVALMQEVAQLGDPRQGYGYLPTYNATSWWRAWPLDHVFYEAGFARSGLVRGDFFGSDHYPYMAQLCRVEKSRSETPEAAESEALEQARQIIRRARRQWEGTNAG